MEKSNNNRMVFENDRTRHRVRNTALMSFPLLMFAATLTIILIQLSGYAGTLEDTQFGFNAATIRNYFSLMSPEDMGLFVAANLVDYLFMLCYGIFFYSTARLISWNYKSGLPNKIGFSFAWIGVIAAFLDGIENVFLLSMAANPVGFVDWLAFAHSSFALVKFLFLYVAMAWTIVGFVINRTPLATYLKSIQIV